MIDFQSKAYWVMGVVNITPDSFSDGGDFFHTDAAIAHGLRLVEQGADILDLGAESTRPGALPVSTEEELSRLLPVIEGLRLRSAIPLSIDTSNPIVMKACLQAGVAMINDVRSFGAAGASDVLADFPQANACIMHMQGEPQTMQSAPHYDDVFAEVSCFLQQRQQVLDLAVGRLVIDPGFGFGKDLAHNLTLFRSLPQLVALGYPVLCGVSRKRMIGELTGRDNAKERLAGSLAAAIEAVRLGARIVRVHDVAETLDALAVSHALSGK